jgi:hypothetical protein
MATNYDPNTNTTTTTSIHTEKRRPWAWIVGAIVLIAIIVAFAMPNDRRAGDSTTRGTPPATTDTMPPAATTPAPTTPPATPY